MNSRLLIGSVLWLMAAVALHALTTTSTYAFVVAVDLKSKQITVRVKPKDSHEWKETVLAWDAKTEWTRAEEHDWDEKPATADLAKDLKKDTNVFVAFSDELSGGKLLLVKLKTLPPGMVAK